jgi:hypothetical protein
MKVFDSFLAADVAYARTLYRNEDHGALVLRLDDAMSEPRAAFATILEHRPVEAQQFRYCIGKAPVPRRLAEGSYTLTVTAPGYEPFRQHLDMAAGKIVEITAKLEKSAAKTVTLREIAARYHIPYDEQVLHDVRVPEGRTITLDTESHEYAKNRHELRITSVDRAKELLGNSDKHWPGDAPRFGRQYRAEPTREDQGGSTFTARAALREYVYGNSKSVSGWRGVLDRVLDRDALVVQIFLLPDIDVGPHATLQVTNVGLLCNVLRVHLTGKVVLTGSGPIRVEMNIYRQYSSEIVAWPKISSLALLE